MPEPIDHRGLVALGAVARRGSIAAAAAELGWSQPTVDHHVRKLERTIGVPLLERGPRGTVPTGAGAVAAARGDEILALGRRLAADAAAVGRDGAAAIRFGAFPTLGARILPAVHALLDAEDGSGWVGRLEPLLDEVGSLVALLHRGELDAALLYTIAGRSLGLGDDVATRAVGDERVALCVPAGHRIERLDTVADLAALRGDRWAFGVDDGDALDATTQALCRAAGFEPVVGMRGDDYAAVLRMVAAGLAIGIVPRSALDAPPAGIRSVDVPPTLLRRELVLAVRRTPGSGGVWAEHEARVGRLLALVQRVTVDAIGGPADRR